MNDISVIIPVYNGEKLLEACLRSVYAAGSRVAEVIIVDDGSTDGTYDAALRMAERDKRIRVIHTDNHGIYMARRTGIELSTSPYVAFIDADDRFCENALDRLADLLERCDADISFGGIVETSKPDAPEPSFVDETVREQTPAQIWPRIMRWRTQEFILYVVHKLYRRETLQGFIEADGICQGEDVLFTCQAFKRAKRIVETTAPVYLYYQNPESMLHRRFGDHDIDLIRVWDSVVELMQDKDLRYMAQINRWRTDFTLICRLILADDPETDARYARELAEWRNSLNAHWRALAGARALPMSRVALIISLRFAFGLTKAGMRLINRQLRAKR